MYKPNFPCDLHTHTLKSDGNDTYLELVDKAVALGMKVVAVTDHDVTPDLKETKGGVDIDIVSYARDKGLYLIPGIEFSCDTDVDDVHIVGLGCDFGGQAFARAEKAMSESKVNGYKKLIEVMTVQGFKMAWDELLEGGRKDSDVQRKHVFELMAKKGYAKTWQEAKLMVKDNPVFNVRREKIDPLDAIAIIHESGGIAILAHPYLINDPAMKDGKPVSRERYIDVLIGKGGLDGIEASYTYSKTSYSGTMSEAEIEAEVRAKYQSRVSIISGGSDYHNDGKKGTENPRMIGEKGVTYDYFMGHPELSRLVAK